MGRTFAERLEAYLLDKEQRKRIKEEREKRAVAKKIKEREEKSKKNVARKEKIDEQLKDEVRKLNLEAAQIRREIKTLQHQEDRLRANVKKINNYNKLTIDVCDLMQWRLQLLIKIQENPYNPHVVNFQNLICDIDEELSKKRARLKYWQKKFK